MWIIVRYSVGFALALTATVMIASLLPPFGIFTSTNFLVVFALTLYAAGFSCCVYADRAWPWEI